MNVEDIVIEPEFFSPQDNLPEQNADKVPLKSRIKQNEQEECCSSELETSFRSEIVICKRMAPKLDHLFSKNDTSGKSISNNPDRTLERQLIRQAGETQDVEITCERKAIKRSPSSCSSERLDCETLNQHGSTVTEPEFVCLDDSVPQEIPTLSKITLRESKSNKRPAVCSSTDNPRLGTKKAISGVCHICGLFRKNLSVHMSKHTGERKFKCPHCPAAFTDSGNCKQHINIHTREKIYKCDLCDKEYTSLNVLRNHKDSHSETKKHVCKTCGNAYQYRPALKRHMKTHTEEPKIKCPECEMRFYYKGRMLLHLRKHYEPEFACEICGKRYTTKSALHNHTKIKHSQK
ncbi:zinc finger protein 672-like [Anopheles cruzii]|uniref:zinc finger protein 672-like n=1 Tax=Anopheles cruzii TaxID=68878 RepID=UPI0022EC900A|nr:zinc finger protein 672-like [Anopheles cruzii]